MLLAVKPYVYGLLTHDSGITALVPATRILYFYPNSFEALPIITYFEINQSDLDGQYYDNLEMAVESTIQIDIWTGLTGASTSTIAAQVDRVMTGALFNKDFAGDMYEADTKIDHRIMRYRRSFTAQDLS